MGGGTMHINKTSRTIGAIDYMRADSAIGFLNFFEGVKNLLT